MYVLCWVWERKAWRDEEEEVPALYAATLLIWEVRHRHGKGDLLYKALNVKVESKNFGPGMASLYDLDTKPEFLFE